MTERPNIRKFKDFDLATCPEVPTFEAGYLVEGNGTWRSKRPMVALDRCIGCLQCYLYCPDGAISSFTPTNGDKLKVQIDYEFCKGCGICVKMCKVGCMQMEAEH